MDLWISILSQLQDRLGGTGQVKYLICLANKITLFRLTFLAGQQSSHSVLKYFIYTFKYLPHTLTEK